MGWLPPSPTAGWWATFWWPSRTSCSRVDWRVHCRSAIVFGAECKCMAKLQLAVSLSEGRCQTELEAVSVPGLPGASAAQQRHAFWNACPPLLVESTMPRRRL
jgi:hypothetical protein